MGVGGAKKDMREIPETRAAGRDEAFEEIIKRLKTAGAKIEEDDTHPYYIDIGEEEFEIGTERIIQFNLNQMDFKLTRRVEKFILQGAGRQKHIEELDIPRVHITLKRKEELSNDWQSVDLEEMF